MTSRLRDFASTNHWCVQVLTIASMTLHQRNQSLRGGDQFRGLPMKLTGCTAKSKGALVDDHSKDIGPIH